MKNHLLVFAKYPEAGRVKTRLALTVGTERAAELYRMMVNTVLRKTTPKNNSYQLQLCYDPPEKEAAFRRWLPDISDWLAQQGTHLGERLQHAFHNAFLQGSKTVIVIGTDCIDIDQPILEAAFESLAAYDVVVGPASDGGYYLIGMKAHTPQLFDGISWSTERVFQETIQKSKALGLSIKTLPILSDIDAWPDAISSMMEQT